MEHIVTGYVIVKNGEYKIENNDYDFVIAGSSGIRSDSDKPLVSYNSDKLKDGEVILICKNKEPITIIKL